MWLRKTKKELKSLIRFHSANKIDNYNRGRKQKEKTSKRVYRASENIRKIYVFLQSNLRVPSLAGNHSSPHLPRMPSNTVLISGPVVGAAQILIWSYSSVFFKCPQLSGLVHFLLWELSVTFYIFHRHRVYLVDRVDLICSLYSW